jgi:hypothetical protein
MSVIQSRARPASSVKGRLFDFSISSRNGLFIFDTDGKTIARLTEAEGLPPADAGVALAAIGQGKMLVAGSFGAEFRGWIAIVENDANTSKFSINVFHKATRAPDPGLIQKRDSDSLRALAKDPQCVFRPEWAMPAPPGPDTPAGAVWIARGRTNELNVGDDEWMRVDLQTLKVSVSDFKPSSVKPLQFISDDEMIVPSGSLYRCRLGRRAQSGRFGSLLLYHAVPESHATFIRCQGRNYVPGSDWYLLDTDSWKAKHLGPGVKVSGHPADFLRSAASSVCGLLGYSEEKFYPISVDPRGRSRFAPRPTTGTGPDGLSQRLIQAARSSATSARWATADLLGVQVMRSLRSSRGMASAPSALLQPGATGTGRFSCRG